MLTVAYREDAQETSKRSYPDSESGAPGRQFSACLLSRGPAALVVDSWMFYRNLGALQDTDSVSHQSRKRVCLLSGSIRTMSSSRAKSRFVLRPISFEIKMLLLYGNHKTLEFQTWQGH